MDTRPTKHVPPKRKAKFSFGETLQRGDFIGRVDTIYSDYWAALDSFAVPNGWFEEQEDPPSTKDQVFYSLIAMDGDGSILAGEAEVRKPRVVVE